MTIIGVVRGASLKGLLFLVLFASCVVGLLGAIGVLPTPTAIPDARLPGISVVVIGLAAVAIYLVSLWEGTRES